MKKLYYLLIIFIPVFCFSNDSLGFDFQNNIFDNGSLEDVFGDIKENFSGNLNGNNLSGLNDVLEFNKQINNLVLDNLNNVFSGTNTKIKINGKNLFITGNTDKLLIKNFAKKINIEINKNDTKSNFSKKVVSNSKKLKTVEKVEKNDNNVSNKTNIKNESKIKTTKTSEIDLVRIEMLGKLNQIRKDNGLKDLVLNDKLNSAAQKYSEYMSKNSYFAHEAIDGTTPKDRIVNEGYKYLSLGENIAAGQKTVDEVIEAWMNSQGHRDNILSSKYTEIGIGMYDGYWVQDFGKPKK